LEKVPCGYSARTLAHCWEDADGLPDEIIKTFDSSGIPDFRGTQLLFAFPEYQVALPGGDRPSQNDVYVIAKTRAGDVVSITIEGKVEEPFGPTLKEWNASESKGRKERLSFLKEKLGLKNDLPPELRYQLLHRTASAVIEAERINARYAVMIVHSFHKENMWFDDFKAFVGLFGQKAVLNKLLFLTEVQGIKIYSGWTKGNEKYLIQ
jgi:hypothetical protein